MDNADVRVYCRMPEEYSNKGFEQGSNVKIFFDILDEINENPKDIKEIHLALYLFNNSALYNNLLKIADMGVKIRITSLPIQGYDKRKNALATSLYNKILLDNKIKLQIYPHMYVWYGVRYGGVAPYSFHIKAGLIKYKSGFDKVFLTSANLAPGDPTHSETAFFITCDANSLTSKIYNDFFDEINKRAVDYKAYKQVIQNFSKEMSQIFDFSYVGNMHTKNLDPSKHNQVFFTAPFLEYENIGSNHYARQKIIEIIKSAHNRLLLCTQHSHDIAPFNGYEGETIIGTLSNIVKNNPNIDVRILKQTASSGLSEKRRASFTECHLYYAGIPQRVNKIVHDKFIIADDNVLFTTGNFTTTQFAWGKKEMDYPTKNYNIGEIQKTIKKACSFFKIPSDLVIAKPITSKKKNQRSVKIRRNDVFSEVNAYFIIENKEVANTMYNYFIRLWNHKLTNEVKIPI